MDGMEGTSRPTVIVLQPFDLCHQISCVIKVNKTECMGLQGGSEG